ncbi:MAG TPA: hypothetical protein VF903_12425 [Nitrospirota bacterium]
MNQKGRDDGMVGKPEAEKSKKQRQSSSTKTAKPPCGTLSYIAACRGMTQKSAQSRWPGQPGNINQAIRKYPAGEK